MRAAALWHWGGSYAGYSCNQHAPLEALAGQCSVVFAYHGNCNCLPHCPLRRCFTGLELNDQVQGGAPSYRNNLLLFKASWTGIGNAEWPCCVPLPPVPC